MNTAAHRRRTMRGLSIGLAALLTLGGCSAGSSLDKAVEATVPETAPPASVAPKECTAAERAEDPTRSFEPQGTLPSPNNMPAGSTMAEIHDRGRLVVGVSGDTLLFGSRNPLTGAIEGFDIDMLKEVAKAIFGPDGENKIEYRVISYAQRLPKLEQPVEAGGVDIVAHTMTINCNRWLRIAFSTNYYDAGQTVLVRKGSGFTSVEDLVAAKAQVCAPSGSTNIDEIRQPKYAGIEVVEVPDVSDCLVTMQQGKADAITGDDTVLAGFAAQDPTTEVVAQKAFTAEPYGLGMGRDKIDFVRFVNGVLEDVRSSGRWKEIYQRWLIDTNALPPPIPDPPQPVYGRDE